ncbi:DNA polymerase ligase N-terminal domain-containing protein [Streptomyces gobiensis]|uniref:DNA polymerase ligase N-terminal domain-containing protein n=1 Tax=Streptomyces gobiensis TaxID=2875706 RepID=UPI001E39280F|nr:DNA polymerase ligase N-terminal domain-containing protein [Streptomyces gobiensis]UGY94602.1 3'-phosphoesterase [Streptomyces gobiensis]
MSSLQDYERKRNVRRSGEPKAEQRASRGEPRFVIQKHSASTLHYDFRLETDGVLKSWAVPKGPSTDPQEKRLAQPTEDHPLDYADFEGVIPEGEYGAGTVLVWDTGTYRNLVEESGKPVPVARQIEDGHVKVWLNGEKLTGGYVLQRIGRGSDGRWLLIKVDDEEADRRRNPVSTQEDDFSEE